jgi:hypothetical protein
MLLTRMLRASLLALAATLTTAHLAAQTSPGVLYRLDAPSHYVEGCWAPCQCPLTFHEDLLGTFTLRFSHNTVDWFAVYDVEDVNWVLAGPTEDQHITGHGQYWIGGDFALQHRLHLDLSIDGGASQHYDSGFQFPTTGFPAIDIDVSQNGMVCFDRVFSVSATPVPQEEIIPYALRRSAYLEGCYGVCLCVLNLWRLGGTFDLVPLYGGSNPQRSDYALVAVDWATLPVVPPDRVFSGSGIYSLSHADGTHRLQLAATDDVHGLQHYDSHWLPGGNLFPEIHVDVSVNDYFCFDQVVKLHAKLQ